MKKRLFGNKLALLTLLALLFTGFKLSGSETNGFDTKDVTAVFVQNAGQLVDFNSKPISEMLYYYKSATLDIYFRENGITYIFKKGDQQPNMAFASEVEVSKLGHDFMNAETQYYRMDVNFSDADAGIAIAGEGKSSVANNYYLAHCPDGILNVPSFSAIRYRNVYNGIDFLFYIKNGKLKYDIEVNNPLAFDKIALELVADGSIELINNSIAMQSPVGEIVESLPSSYFMTGNKEGIEIKYELANNIVRFSSVNPLLKPFVIDPEITWTTYYDDCFWNGSGSSIDVKGNQVVITSYGFSDLFPPLNPGGSAYYQNLTAGSGDYRILKFDSNGVIVWATYYGGTGYDHSPRVKIDYNGNIYVAGHTESSNIPIQTASGYYDATYDAGTYGGGTCILKFNSSGVRQWGSHYDYVSYPYIEIDHNNNVYVVGRAEYDNPPVLFLAGAYNQATTSLDASGTSHSSDLFIIKFNSSTTRLWATNVGSTSDEIMQDLHCGTDNYLNILAYGDNYYGNGIITANPGGSAHYDNTLGIGTGGSSTDRDDALIYRFNTSGVMYWGTAFSGTLNENMQQSRITTDASNNVFIYGETRSTDLPCVNPGGGAYFDNVFNVTGGSTFVPFIARFTSSGVLNWSTYFGTYGLGYGMNFSNYIGFNSDNNMVLVISDAGGVGGTHQVVARAGDYNAALLVYQGVYIAEFNSSMGIDWSTYYAGTTDRHSLGDCALSSDGCGYQLYMTTNWEKYNAAASDPLWEKPIPTSYQDVTWQTTGNRSGLITRFSSNPPDATISAAGPFCASDAATTLTAATTGGTWSGTGVNAATGLFNPATAGVGVHTITYTISGSCGDVGTLDITVTASADATITPAGPFCVTDGPTTLSVATAGGSFAGTGVNSSTGVFTPSVAGLGLHQIIYTISGACGAADTININVVTNSDATITPAGPFCTNDASATLSAVDAGGTWVGTGITNATTGIFDPATAGQGTHEIIYTIAGGCGAADTISIIVNAFADATITPAGPFCLLDAATTLTAANSGGVWAGTGITNTTTGTFDPATAGVGSHDIIYTTSGSCADADTITIVVASILDATITPAGPFCISDVASNLTAANTGGTWSGTGITNTSNGTFDPTIAGIGTHEIVYTTSGSCSDTDTIQISVVSQLDATIATQSPVCDNEAAFNLSAANPGGTWSGTGITNATNGTFDPSVANVGTHTIVYTILGGCGDIDSVDIVVNEAPDISFTSVDESCTGAADGSIDLTISGGNIPYTYTWSPTGSSASLSGLLSGNYIVTVTDANGCSRNQTIVLDDPGIDCDGVIPHAVVPNAFSPNGDGENDMLFVLGEGVSMLNFTVYDRWGEKVFETTSLSVGWDGTFRGKELDPAVFSYYMNVTFVDGTSKIEKGDITLIR